MYPTGFVKNILLYLAQKVGLELQDKPIYRDDYSDIGNISVTAVIANKVATLAMQDSTITIEGESARAKFLQSFLDYYLGDRMDVAAEVALGTGDCIVKPYTDGKRLGVDIVKNGDFAVCESIGNDILSCILKVGEIKNESGLYQRYEVQMVKEAQTESGQETSALIIRNIAFKGNSEIPLGQVPAWKDIPEEQIIPNVDRPLFGRYKSPTVNRADVNGVNGVKITAGVDGPMAKAVEAYERFNREYSAKETMIFADKALLTKDENGNVVFPQEKRRFFQMMRGGGDNTNPGKLIQEFSPEIRGTDLEVGITVNNKMVELLCGLSPGILTPPTTSYATATEMRAALNSTFAVITKFRRALERGTDDLLRAVDVIANYNNLAPIGDWDTQYDWSASYIEQLNEHFNQLTVAEGIGAVDKAEVRAWMMDEDYETAKARVEEIAEETGSQYMEEAAVQPVINEPTAE